MGKENVVQALIDKGCRVNEPDDFGITPLMTLWRVNDISLCLLRAGARCEGLEQVIVYKLLLYAWDKRDMLAMAMVSVQGFEQS